MLRALLVKDLRRAWRNPVPWLINIALPLCITALVGLAFGGKTNTGLGRIRFALVDEDQSALTGFLRGAVNQGDGARYLDPVFLDREAALRQIHADKVSAVLIIPTNFTRHFLLGTEPVKLELIKNPAQSIHPTVIEELLGVVVTGLNALARNFQSEFPAWREAFDGEVDYHQVAALIERSGKKIESLKTYIHPPLVVYAKDSTNSQAVSATPPATNAQALWSGASNAPARRPSAAARPARSSGASASPIFAYLLPGMAAMFLLFLANNAMTDLQRELRFRTFERYQTLRQQLLPFVLGKVLFAVVLLLFSGAVMLGGGGLAFGIRWQQPAALALLVVAYACFAAGLMAVFSALLPDERRAGALGTVAAMLLGIASGCMFPREQMPRLIGLHLAPLLPSNWFLEAARALQFEAAPPWPLAAMKLALLGGVLVAAAVWVFQRRFRTGSPA